MSDEDQEKLKMLIEQIQQLLPEFDTFMLSEDSLILTSLESLKDVAGMLGIDMELGEDAEQDLIEFFNLGDDDDDDDDDDGGTLH